MAKPGRPELSELLRPSLRKAQSAIALPSKQSLFLTAFIGGPLALLGLLVLAEKEATARGRGLAAFLGYLWLVVLYALARAKVLDHGHSLGLEGRDLDMLLRHGSRLLALLLVLLYLRWRADAFRVFSTLGMNHPNLGVQAIACVLGAWALQAVVLMLAGLQVSTYLFG